MKLLPVAAALALLLLLGAAPASAHAYYASSTPAASAVLQEVPTEVRIVLTEPAQAGTASIRVTDPAGARVDEGPAQVSSEDPRVIFVGLRPLEPGVYTVTWHVISAVDGHFSPGSFSFGVLNPDGSLPGFLPGTVPAREEVLSPVDIAFRALSFLGLATAVGTTAFLLWAWRPAFRSRREEGSEGPLREGSRDLLRLATVGALLFAVGVAGWWVHTLVVLAPPSTPAGLVGSPFLVSLALRLALGLAFLGALLLALRSSPDVEAPRRPVLALGLGVAALGAGTLGSHGFATQAWWPAGGIADGLHLLGVSLWVGGLLALLAVRKALKGHPAGGSEVLLRFSRLAGYAVAVVLAAGLALTALLVGSLEALLGERYGWVVLAKVTLFVPMVVMGGYNRYRLLPSLRPEASPTGVFQRVLRNVRIEALLGAAVLVLAGLLTAMAPVTSAIGAAGPFRSEALVDGVVVDFEIIPFPTEPGVYVFSVFLWTEDDRPYEGAAEATLIFTHQDSDLPPQTVPLSGPHANHFGGESPALSRPGTWRIDVEVTRTEGLPLRASFEITLEG